MPGDLQRSEVPLGVREDFDETLEGLLAAGHAVSAEGYLLREQRGDSATESAARRAGRCSRRDWR